MELAPGDGGTVLVSKPVAALVGMDSSIPGRQRADFAVAEGVHARTTAEARPGRA